MTHIQYVENACVYLIERTLCDKWSVDEVLLISTHSGGSKYLCTFTMEEFVFADSCVHPR